MKKVFVLVSSIGLGCSPNRNVEPRAGFVPASAAPASAAPASAASALAAEAPPASSAEAAPPASTAAGSKGAELDDPFIKPASVFCFSWVHGPDASTDCYATQAECSSQRAGVGTNRLPTPCSRATDTACTMVSRPDRGPEKSLRCFGNLPLCEAYRHFLARDRDGFVTARCK